MENLRSYGSVWCVVCGEGGGEEEERGGEAAQRPARSTMVTHHQHSCSNITGANYVHACCLFTVDKRVDVSSLSGFVWGLAKKVHEVQLPSGPNEILTLLCFDRRRGRTPSNGRVMASSSCFLQEVAT